ncbi:MAG: hypothetical protein ACLU4J_11860 [Butyricimonas paravirosa]
MRPDRRAVERPERGDRSGGGGRQPDREDQWLNDYKVMTQIDEHYIDRVRKGLTATLERQGKDFQWGDQGVP